MKPIEKKLNIVVQNGNNVSPRLLDAIKERISENPLTKEECKPASVRRNTRFALKTVLSACSVFIVCFFTFFLCLPLFMRANAPSPDGNYPYPSGVFSYEEFEISKLSDDLAQIDAKRYEYELLFIDGTCKMSEMTIEGSTTGHISEYEKNGINIIITQMEEGVYIEEYERFIGSFEGYPEISFIYKNENDYRLTVNVYLDDDGNLLLSTEFRAKIIYIQADGATMEQLAEIARELTDSTDRYV